jgi:hypothetical protein
MEVSGQIHAPYALPPWKNLGIHWTIGWVDLIVCLEVLETKKPPSYAGIRAWRLQSVAKALHQQRCAVYAVGDVISGTYCTEGNENVCKCVFEV